MRLIFLPANNAYVFVFGDQLTRLEGFPLFFQTRREAVDAAHARGLNVDRRGRVTAAKNMRDHLGFFGQYFVETDGGTFGPFRSETAALHAAENLDDEGYEVLHIVEHRRVGSRRGGWVMLLGLGQVQSFLQGWPPRPQEVAMEVVRKYGPPHEVGPSRLISHRTGSSSVGTTAASSWTDVQIIQVM